jgi:chitin-binding protein
MTDSKGQKGYVLHSLTINPGGGGSHPAYPAGKPYKAGDIVSNQGKNYRCKPWPYTDWCNGSADAYAPGTGRAWTEAWELAP